MENWLVRWNGPLKIRGIRALRSVFGFRLKEAIDVLDNDDGFVITPLQWLALRGEYMLGVRAPGGDVEPPYRVLNDWLVEEYKPPSTVFLVDRLPADLKVLMAQVHPKKED